MNRQVKWLGEAPVQARQVRWLGQPGTLGVVPAACWSVPGFSACSDASFKAAQTLCYKYKDAFDKGLGNADAAAWVDRGSNFSTCTSYENTFGINACVDKFCKPQAPVGNHPWGVYTAETKALQDQLNVELAKPDPPYAPYGYMPINADGKLGPATCGAADAVYPEIKPGTCAGHSATPPTPKPAPGGGGGPVTPTPDCSDTKPCPAGQACVNGKCEPTAPPPSSSSKSSGSGIGLLILGGVAAAGVLFLGPAIFGKGGTNAAMAKADAARAARLLENRRGRRGGYAANRRRGGY